MALMMIHLLVAERWAARHPEYLDDAEFYFGAIAPDAIHVRDGNDKSNKNAIHYGNWKGSNPEAIRERWLNCHTSFETGYIVHCLTDGIWVDGYRSNFPELLFPDGRTNPRLYYRDVYATEQSLFDTYPSTKKFFNLIRDAKVPDDHIMLTREEFCEWRTHVLFEYDLEHPAIGAWRARSARQLGMPEPLTGPAVYITPEYIEHFVSTVADRIETILEGYTMNEVLKTIEERRSIRAYDSVAVPEDVVEAIVKAGMQAPTARNLQPWHFSVVSDRRVLDTLDAAMSNDKSVTYKAPLMIAISAPVERSFFAKIDCGIAVQTMALAAWSLGYGSVILGAPRIAFTGDKGSELNKLFCFPEGHEFIIGLAVGKALSSKDAHDLRPEQVTYIK